MNCKLRFGIKVLMLFVCINFEAFAIPGNCIRKFYDTLIEVYERDAGLKFVPDRLSKYWFPPQLHPSRRRTTVARNVYLSLSEDDDLEGIARTLSTGRSYDEILSQLVIAAKGEGSINLAEVTPKIVKDLANKTKPFCKKANCFNATLNWHFEETGIKYTSEDEIEDVLKSNFTQLKKGDKLTYGNVLVFRNGDMILHTAIYIDDNLIWHKPGASGAAPYSFEIIEGAIASYFNPNNKNHSLTFYKKTK